MSASYHYDDYGNLTRPELINIIESLKRYKREAEIWQSKHERAVDELHQAERTIWYLRDLVREYKEKIECLEITSWPISLICYLWRG